MTGILRSAALALAVGLSVAPPARAQLPDLNLIALDWLRGRWASPVVCQRDGDATRALRRLVVAPGPVHARPVSDRITFHGVDVEGASRCSDAVGVPAPDVRGSILVTLPGTSRPDFARSDFQRALRETGGFDFEVVSGRLRLLGWGDEAKPRLVDFAGGTVRAREVRRGSDAARILADLDGPRKLTVEVESADGAETLSFHLVLYDFR
jgi:hypothetical protein